MSPASGSLSTSTRIVSTGGTALLCAPTEVSRLVTSWETQGELHTMEHWSRKRSATSLDLYPNPSKLPPLLSRGGAPLLMPHLLTRGLRHGCPRCRPISFSMKLKENVLSR
uniref:Uncharacterized protein n=1 Tax=Cacopsylla melanoneura TaxID=428564 RepID=A0A8D8Z8H6_9HEMI